MVSDETALLVGWTIGGDYTCSWLAPCASDLGRAQTSTQEKGESEWQEKMKVKLTMDTILSGSFSLDGVRGIRVGTNECFEVRRAKAL